MNSKRDISTTQIIEAFSSQYEILEEIGHGGMSTVFKAVQRNLNRTVALKVVPKNFTHDKEFVARFYREAQSAARLNHPNVVTIFDVGEMGGYPFISMEYLSGGTISELITRKGYLNEVEIKNVIIPVLSGLAYSHAQGIIHRDIKSSNIMLDHHGKPVLMDFGIAKSGEGTKLTRVGTIMGTPEYMSPEQADGNKKVNQQSDVYSIGIVIYEMATGRVPFQADTAIAALHKVIHEYPTNPGLLNKKLSKSMINSICRAMLKDPNERYKTCDEFASAILKGENKHISFMNLPRAHSTGSFAVMQDNSKSGFNFLKTAIVGVFAGIIIIAAYMLFTFLSSTVQVPELKGMHYLQAEKQIKSHGLRMKIGKVLKTNENKNGIVVKQYPPPGELKKWSRVTLDIYKKYVSIPTLTNKKYDEVDKILRAKKLKLEKVEHVFHPTVRKGLIIGLQSNETEIPEGKKVTLLVSKGTELAQVPDIEELTLQKAETKLKLAGFAVGKIKRVESKENKADIVVSYSHRLGQTPKGTRIDITISIEMVEIPNLKNVPLAKAKEKLENLNLQIGNIQKTISDINKGDVVLSTTPLKGRVRNGTKIDVTVSTEMTQLEDLSGETLVKCKSSLKQFGLKVGNIKKIESKYDQGGIVISTTPKEGRFAKGTKIDVTVSSAMVRVPVVTDQNFTSAKNVLQNLGLKVKLGKYLKTFGNNKNTIASQSVSNKRVKKGSQIILDVFKKYVNIPSINRLSETQAKSKLRNTGFKVQTTKWRFNSNIGRGLVIGIESNASNLAEGSSIVLMVSKGKNNFVNISGSTFRMGNSDANGDADELPFHLVTVNDFGMWKYEITNKEVATVYSWALLKGKIKKEGGFLVNTEGDKKNLIELNDADCKIVMTGNNISAKTGYEDKPCVEITWFGALAFCNYMSEQEELTTSYNLRNWSCDFSANGYRLPTEAEWEFAARGGVKTQNSASHKYAGSNSISEVAWYSSNASGKAHPIGTKRANNLGLYDMSGNVWEWCWDNYDTKYYKDSVRNNPRGPSSGANKVIRGGSWSSNRMDCRIVNRNSNKPIGEKDIGFRIVK